MGAGVHMTMSAWVWLADKAQFGWIVGKGSTPAAHGEYGFVYSNTLDAFQWRLSNGTSNTLVTDTILLGSPLIETWYHLAGYYDGVVSQFVINGQIEAINSLAYTLDIQDSTAPFRIGEDDGVGPLWFAGRVANVGVWKRVLTAAELMQLYQGGLRMNYAALPAGLLTNLQGFWDLDGDANDKSGNGNNLTNTNGVTFLTAER